MRKWIGRSPKPSQIGLGTNGSGTWVDGSGQQAKLHLDGCEHGSIGCIQVRANVRVTSAGAFQCKSEQVTQAAE